MTNPSGSGADGPTSTLGRLAALGDRAAQATTAWLGPLALLALRLPVAAVFWRSGQTKVEGWNIFAVNETQYFLFKEEFGMPWPELSAHVTAIAEHVLPVLLVVGLLTRLGALGMLVMTMVIQLFVFPDAWFNAHMFWAAILFAVLALGPGPLSLDHLMRRRLRQAEPRR